MRYFPAAIAAVSQSLRLLTLICVVGSSVGLAMPAPDIEADFHLDKEALPEVELDRPACDSGDDDCPWWVYGNTFGYPKKLTVGLVFRTVSFGPISARMHCYNAGCNDATSMFGDTSDNFNATGDEYCAAVYYGGFSPSEICGQVAPEAYVLANGNDFPFEPPVYLAAGFKTGGDRTQGAYLRVYDIHFIYEGPPGSGYYFGADTNVNPLRFPRDEQTGFDFYIGRLGSGKNSCRIHKDGWDILYLPDQVPVPNDEKCQFEFKAVEDMALKLGPDSARRRTYAYWFLQGPRFHQKTARQWGLTQARRLFQQVKTYRKWIDGRTLFADIEPPLGNPSGDTWLVCVEPESGGTITYPEDCRRNRAVLEGFLAYVALLKAIAVERNVPEMYFEPGVYTTPGHWITYFGVDYVPRAPTIMRPPPQPTLHQTNASSTEKQSFVLWITGCASGDGTYVATEADEIEERDLLSIVMETALGGSRAVLWQYHFQKPDFNVTLQEPSGGFSPVSSSVPYNCTCDDPALWRSGVVGSCPDLVSVPAETSHLSR